MSFFDEPEETQTRTQPRTAPRRRRPTGGSRRPPSGGRRRAASRQTIQIRRAVLFVAVVVAIVLIAVLVNSCQVSARNTALKDYSNNVASLNQQSVSTGATFFQVLSGGTSDPTSLRTHLNQAVSDAAGQLRSARRMNVPDEVKSAHQNLVLALQMRHDGMLNIANDVQPALQQQTSRDAVNSIAAEMARFYGSDVLYKDYSVPLVIGALRAAGITVGGLSGEQINAGQFLPDVRWLTPAYVASQLHVTLPSSRRTKVAPGVHGHQLGSVSAGGSTLQTGSTNTISASPPPTFTLNFVNTGHNTENNVVCKVTISGSKVSGQTAVPQTTPGQQASCQVTLNSAPPTGSQTVTATIEPVPGEKNASNNSLTFPVTFQ